jgi:3-oxoacyl-[acyl-carrier protein] reductase
MDLGLKDAIAVVQGGTSGMGRAAAECFAAEGAKIAIIARTAASLDATIASLTELGAADVLAISADITQRDQVDAAFARVNERWGQ